VRTVVKPLRNVVASEFGQQKERINFIHDTIRKQREKDTTKVPQNGIKSQAKEMLGLPDEERKKGNP